jgi:hypothetical protein
MTFRQKIGAAREAALWAPIEGAVLVVFAVWLIANRFSRRHDTNRPAATEKAPAGRAVGSPPAEPISETASPARQRHNVHT